MFDPDQKIPHEDLEKIIKAAQNYPCALAKQEADFIVVSNKDLLFKISEKLRLNIKEFTEYLTQRREELGVHETVWCDAPTVVFLVSNDNVSLYREVNIGEAALSIIAAAQSLGYSTLPVLMAANPDASQYTAEYLGVPKENLGLTIAIGKAKPEWKNHIEEKKIKAVVKYID